MKKITPFKIFLEKNGTEDWPLPLTVKMKKNTSKYSKGANLSPKTPEFVMSFYGTEGYRPNAFDDWEDLGEFTNKKHFLDVMSTLISEKFDYRAIVDRISNMEERFLYGNPNKKWRYDHELASGRFDSKGNLKNERPGVW